jgi:hypothetical protein
MNLQRFFKLQGGFMKMIVLVLSILRAVAFGSVGSDYQKAMRNRNGNLCESCTGWSR